MIYASLNAKKGNYQYPAAINTALEFLAKPETAELPVGRYELDGDNIFVLIQDQTTAPVENKRAESHRNYIDIQYLFTGKEVQGYAPLLPGVTGEEPAGKDNIFYETVENEQFVTLHPGEFTVYLLMISTALIVQWMSLLISIRQLLRLRKVLLSNWNS